MNERASVAVDADERRFYRLGGVAAIALVIGWFATFPLYAAAGGPTPFGAEARLIHFAGRESAWWAILWLMVVTDLLYVCVALALYRALRGLDAGLTLLFVAFKGLFVVLDLAVGWPLHAALFNLSSLYAAAASEAERASIVAAAAASSAVLDSLLPALYSIVIPSLGTLFVSLVMFKGIFGRGTAYLGLAAGVTGIIAFADPLLGAWGRVHIVNALLATVWFLLVGWKLYGLGRQTG